MMKITRIKKRIICLMLAVSILVCGVSMQYKKAEAVAIAIPGIAEVASLVAPWGTVVILFTMIAAPVVGALFSPAPGSSSADDLEQIRKQGEGVWKDFKHYYWDEWVNSAKHINDTGRSMTWQEAGDNLMEFKENAQQGFIDTTSDVWDAFLEFVDTMFLDDAGEVSRPHADLAFNEYGCVAVDRLDSYVNQAVKDMGQIGFCAKDITCESDVNIAYLSYIGSNNRLITDVALYSLNPFTATMRNQYREGQFYNYPFNNVRLLEGTSFYYDIVGVSHSGSYDTDDIWKFDTTYPSSCYFRSEADFLEMLHVKQQVIDLDPEPEYVLPSPWDWTWEKTNEVVKPEDVPDVIVLQPDAVTEHAESNDAAVAELERLIELALAQEIPWSQVFEYLNIDFADVAPVEPDNPSTDVPEEKPSDDSTVKPSTDIPYSYSGLEKIFPFCIPFDIYKFLNLMDAKAEAPSFKWTFVVYKKKYNLEIDLEKWDDIASVLRAMELIAFCVGLAIITRSKLIRS